MDVHEVAYSAAGGLLHIRVEVGILPAAWIRAVEAAGTGSTLLVA